MCMLLEVHRLSINSQGSLSSAGPNPKPQTLNPKALHHEGSKPSYSKYGSGIRVSGLGFRV